MVSSKDLDHQFVILNKKHRSCFDKLLMDVGALPSPPWFLKTIFDHPGCTQKELGQILQITPASVTSNIQKLEASGHVRREYDEKDHRRSNVFLTDKGLDATEKVNGVIKEISGVFLNGFSEEEKQMLMNCFRRMSDNLDSIICGRGGY